MKVYIQLSPTAFASVTIWRGAPNSYQPKFSGFCTKTSWSHLAVFCIAIECHDFVQSVYSWVLGFGALYKFSVTVQRSLSLTTKLEAVGSHGVCFAFSSLSKLSPSARSFRKPYDPRNKQYIIGNLLCTISGHSSAVPQPHWGCWLWLWSILCSHHIAFSSLSTLSHVPPPEWTNKH